MDERRKSALCEAVNALGHQPEICSISELSDCQFLVKIITELKPDFVATSNYNLQSRVQILKEFLAGHYKNLNGQEIDVDTSKEDSIARAILLVLCALVQKNESEQFRDKLCQLKHEWQIPIKKMMEEVLTETDCGILQFPKRPSKLQTNSFSSEKSPMRELFDSPEMARKLELQALNIKVRNLTGMLIEERNLRTDIQEDLTEKQNQITSQDKIIQETRKKLAAAEEAAVNCEIYRQKYEEGENEAEKLNRKLKEMGYAASNAPLLESEISILTDMKIELETKVEKLLKLNCDYVQKCEQLPNLKDEIFQLKQESAKKDEILSQLSGSNEEFKYNLWSNQEYYEGQILELKEQLNAKTHFDFPTLETVESIFTKKLLSEQQDLNARLQAEIPQIQLRLADQERLLLEKNSVIDKIGNETIEKEETWREKMRTLEILLEETTEKLESDVRKKVKDLQEAEMKIQEITEFNAEKVEFLERQLAETKEKFSAEIQERDEIVNNMKNDVQSLQMKLSDAEELSAGKDERVSEMTEEMKELEASTRHLKLNIQEMEEMLSEAENNLAASKNREIELGKLKIQIEELVSEGLEAKEKFLGLRHQADELEKELEEKKDVETVDKKEINDLEKKLGDLERELDRRKEIEEVDEKEIKDLEEKLAETKKFSEEKVEVLNFQVIKSEKKFFELQVLAEELERQLEDKNEIEVVDKKEIKDLEEKLAVTKSFGEDKIKMLEIRVSESEENFFSMRDFAEELGRQLVVKEEIEEFGKREINMLKEKLADLERELEMKKEIEVVDKKKIEDLEERFLSMKDLAEEMGRQFLVKEEIEEFGKREIKDLREKLADLESELDRRKEIEEVDKKEIKDLEEKLAETKKFGEDIAKIFDIQVIESEKKFSSFKDFAEELEKQLQDKKDIEVVDKKEIEHLEEKLAEAKSLTEDKVKMLEIQTSEFEKTCFELRDWSEKLEGELEKKKEIEMFDKKEIQNLEEKLAETKKLGEEKVKTLEIQFIESEKNFFGLKDFAEELERQLEDKKEIKDLEEKLAEARSLAEDKIKMLEIQVSESEEKYRGLRDWAERLEKQLEDEKEFEILDKKLTELEKELEAKKEIEIIRSKEFEDLERKLEETTSLDEDKFKMLEVQVSKSVKRCLEIQDCVEKLERELEKKEETEVLYKKEIEYLEEKLTEAEGKVKVLREEMSVREKDLKGALEIAESEVVKMNEKSRRHELRYKSLLAERTTMVSKCELLDDKTSEMKTAAEVLQAKYEKAKSLLKYVDGERTALEEHLQKQNADIEKLVAYGNAKEENLKDVNGKLLSEQEKCKGQSAQLDALKSENEKIRKKLEEKDSRLEWYYIKVQDLEEQVNILRDRYEDHEKPSCGVVPKRLSLPWTKPESPVLLSPARSVVDFAVPALPPPRYHQSCDNIYEESRRKPTVPYEMGRYFSCEDEEGEFLNHNYLDELKGGKCKASSDIVRASELQRRNTLCLPHLKSSYPIELQTKSNSVFSESMLKAPDKILTVVQPNFDNISTSTAGPSTECDLSNTVPKKLKVSKATYQKPGPPTPGKKGIKTPGSLKRLLGSRKRDENNPNVQKTRKNLAFSIGFSPKYTNGSAKKKLQVFRAAVGKKFDAAYF